MDVGSFFIYEGSVPEFDEVAASFVESPGAILPSANDTVALVKGSVVRIGKDAKACVLWPPARSLDEYIAAIENGEDENRSSLLVRFENRGVSVIMTGDIGFEGETGAMQANASGAGQCGSLSADILKIGHHGSKTSTSEDFLEAIDPAVAVIQVGRNNYGHPTPEVLAKLDEHDIIVFRNDCDGAVLVTPKNDGLRIRTARHDIVSPMLLKAYERNDDDS